AYGRANSLSPRGTSGERGFFMVVRKRFGGRLEWASSPRPCPPKEETGVWRLCPGGTSDNSPTFQRWVMQSGCCISPEGTAELSAMSYISSYFHCVFSTKERQPLIPPPLRERLWPFLGGIARQNGMKAIEIGGVAGHVHILLSLPSTLSIAKALQLIK